MNLCSRTKFLFLQRNRSDRTWEQCERRWEYLSWSNWANPKIKLYLEGENPGTVSGSSEKWNGKSGRGEIFEVGIQLILNLAGNNEKQTCYQVLMMYGHQEWKQWKWSTAPFLPNTFWESGTCSTSQLPGKAKCLFIKHVADVYWSASAVGRWMECTGRTVQMLRECLLWSKMSML